MSDDNDNLHDDTAAIAEAEFRTAISVARDALAAYNDEPLVESKRGGVRRNPAFLSWREASSIAIRYRVRRTDRSCGS